MAQGYFIVHLEDNIERTEVVAELRYFAYPGAFASTPMDSFLLRDYELQPTILHYNYGSKPFHTKNATVHDILSEKGQYSKIVSQCKEIFLKRNPNLSADNIQ